MSEISKEAVALELLKIIAAVEGKNLAPATGDDDNAPGTQWVFKTYAKCMALVENLQAYAAENASVAKAKKITTAKRSPSAK